MDGGVSFVDLMIEFGAFDGKLRCVDSELMVAEEIKVNLEQAL